MMPGHCPPLPSFSHTAGAGGTMSAAVVVGAIHPLSLYVCALTPHRNDAHCCAMHTRAASLAPSLVPCLSPPILRAVMEQGNKAHTRTTVRGKKVLTSLKSGGILPIDREKGRTGETTGGAEPDEPGGEARSRRRARGTARERAAGMARQAPPPKERSYGRRTQ